MGCNTSEHTVCSGEIISQGESTSLKESEVGRRKTEEYRRKQFAFYCFEIYLRTSVFRLPTFLRFLAVLYFFSCIYLLD
jgi:hypothetical protein